MPQVFPRLAVLFVVDEDEAKRIHFFDEFAVSIEIPSPCTYLRQHEKY